LPNILSLPLIFVAAMLLVAGTARAPGVDERAWSASNGAALELQIQRDDPLVAPTSQIMTLAWRYSMNAKRESNRGTA
jgi:hypothetical protein